IDAASERIDAGITEIAVVVDVHVVRRVERLVLEPRDRREELARAFGSGVVELTLPLGGRVGPRARILGRGHSSAASSNAAEFLGREHQARGRTRPQQGWSALLRARVDSGAA